LPLVAIERCVGIGQGYLFVVTRHHLSIQPVEALYFLAQLRDLLLEPCGLGLRHRRTLTISRIELREIAGDALVDLFQTPLHLGLGEILVTIVHRLELAAIDRHAGFGEQTHRATERNKPGADLPDGATVVLAEIGNRLVIRNKAAREPHHLNIAPGLALQPAARLNPIEIAVDIELQQYRRMIRRPAGLLRSNPAEPKRGQIEFVDKDIDYANRIVLADPVFHTFRKQRALLAIHPLNKALHPILRKSCGNHIARITQGGSFSHRCAGRPARSRWCKSTTMKE
jgi:hypothetical protein